MAAELLAILRSNQKMLEESTESENELSGRSIAKSLDRLHPAAQTLAKVRIQE
jgi:hypothetical protein